MTESSVVLPPVKRERTMNTRKIPVDTPAVGVILEAPPVLVASEHSWTIPGAVAAGLGWQMERIKVLVRVILGPEHQKCSV